MRRLIAAFAFFVLSSTGGASTAGAQPLFGCQPATAWRSLVLVSAKTGAVDRGFPDVDENVDVVLADGHGGWFVAGAFGCFGKSHMPGLMHLNADGSLDGTWRPARPVERAADNGHPEPLALALSGRTLYAGSRFGVEALDAKTGAVRWRTVVRGAAGVVALAADAHAVYVAGDFDRVAGSRQPTLAALDARTGHLRDWHAGLRKIASAYVNALALSGSRLLIGGDFVGGKTLAAVDARTGRLAAWSPPHSIGEVETIVVAKGEAFTAGHDGFGVTDLRSGSSPAWVKHLHLSSYRFAASGKLVYLAGNCRDGFDSIGGRPRNNLAAVDLSTKTVTDWAPNVDKYTCVNAIAASDSQVLVAGSFSKTLG